MAETLTIRTASSTEVIQIAVPGPQGATGQGVPVGGSTGEVLRKASGTNYDTEWAAAGSGSGSVTSVALAGTGLSISGSPITTSGTITANVAYGTTAGTATQGNDSRIANITANSITTAQGANSGGAGGTITMRGGVTGSNGAGGNAGSINLRGSDDREEGAFNGGSIDLSAMNGTGGSITSTGTSEGAGGSLNMSGNSFAGGSINTAGGVNGAGGSIDTSDDGGSINLRGTGSIGFGESGTRTTLTGTATADRAISLPDASGRIQVEGQPIGNTTPAAITATTLAANNGTITASAPVLDLSQTWNASGTTFTALRLNATNTASASASLLMDLQTSGTSQFSVRRDGRITLPLSGGGIQIGTGSALIDAVGGSTIGIRACQLGWDNNAIGIANQTFILGDAANVISQRNGTAAQEYRLHGAYSSSTNYQRMTVKSVKQTLSALSGASATTTGTFIPDGAVVVGVTTRVTTLLTGASGYTIGDGTDADRWGDITGTAIGTTSDNRDWTAGTIECFTAGGNITLTAKTANFTAGAIEVCAFYLAGEAD